MDEPLCFVHFINALTCSHKASGGWCSGAGGNRNARRQVLLPQPFFPGKGSGEVNGSSLWALRGLVLCGAREKVASLGQPDLKR